MMLQNPKQEMVDDTEENGIPVNPRDTESPRDPSVPRDQENLRNIHGKEIIRTGAGIGEETQW